MLSRYEQAQTLLQGLLTTRIAKNDVVYPHWIEGSHCFWYLRETENGNEFRLVNIDAASNTLAFDHKAIADNLALATGQTISVDKLPIKQVTITLSPTQVCFRAFEKNWQFDTNTATCKETIFSQKINSCIHFSELARLRANSKASFMCQPSSFIRECGPERRDLNF